MRAVRFRMNRRAPVRAASEMHLLCHEFVHREPCSGRCRGSLAALVWCATFPKLPQRGAFSVRLRDSPGYNPAKLRRSVAEWLHQEAALPPCQGRLQSLESARLAQSFFCECMDPRFIDDLAKRLSAAVPQGLADMGRDLEENFKAVLQSALAKMDLVTRQEFDVQAGVLRRTREKLEALEAKIAELERTKNS
jgi:ubiquinone biosynthesis accessory factor UbiK